jgi:hypothetical protein
MWELYILIAFLFFFPPDLNRYFGPANIEQPCDCKKGHATGVKRDEALPAAWDEEDDVSSPAPTDREDLATPSYSETGAASEATVQVGSVMGYG